MAFYTPTQFVFFGEATTYLMANDQALGSLFHKRLINRASPTMVAIITDILNWEIQIIDQAETEGTDLAEADTLDGVGQLLYWMCGEFSLQAQNLSGGGDDPVVPPTSPMPNPIEFEVNGASFIPTAGSSVVIPQFVNYNVIFVRNYTPQSQINTQPAYFTWNRVTGIFTCSPAALATEFFSINPV